MSENTIFISVKQQVNDISETLAGLLSELQSLRKTVNSLYAENRSLNRDVDRLLKGNRELRKRLEKYEKPPKDSSNSSTPPSKKPIKAEIEHRTKSLRKKSDKPVSGQINIKGPHAKWWIRLMKSRRCHHNIAANADAVTVIMLHAAEAETPLLSAEISVP
ncbi:MAG: DNA replication initiation control protein YabA [Bacteroides sp.]|nr:DNA replication initiation control protein YabA [Bacteroides sp.]